MVQDKKYWSDYTQEKANALFKKWTGKISTINEASRMNCICLTEWDSEFLESIDRQLNQNGSKPLTWKQEKYLSKIYERIE